jgi:hypothetical protein
LKHLEKHISRKALNSPQIDEGYAGPSSVNSCLLAGAG